MITEPLLEILGIDEHAKTKRTDRTREGVQKFFDIKIKELKTMAEAEVVSDKEKLIKACAGKIAKNIAQQSSQIAFFNQDNQGQVRDSR